MKTQRERLIELLAEFGISPCSYSSDECRGNWKESDVILYSQKGNVEGYYEFYCRFDFDKDGNFKSVGIWE